MYKIASDLAQSRASRIHVQTGVTEITADDERASIKAAIEGLIVARGVANKKEKQAIGLRIFELQQRAMELKTAYKKSPTIERHFVDICKETMPIGQFSALMKAARKRAEND